MRNPIVVGERVYLRPLEEGDHDIQARYAAGEVETVMNRWRIPYSAIAYEQYLETQHTHLPPPAVAFAVCLREDDAMIGVVDLEEIDWINRTGETASWIGATEYRGKGYGTEAKHLLLEYAFDRIHLHVVRSWVIEPNTRSARALAKQGYRLAGRHRWIEMRDGKWVDALAFDVLRDEWVAARDAWQAAQRG